MDLKKYNNLLTSGRWYNKDPQYDHIMALFVVAQNITDESNGSSDKSNRESKKLKQAYIRYLLPWMLEYPKGRVVKITTDRK